MPEPTPALTCKEVADFLADYLGGAVSVEERAAFEAHLVHCEECLAYLQSYRSTVRAVRAIGQSDEEATREVPDELVRAIVAARRHATSGDR
jgi:anti-sigma factor RsiW